MRLPRVRFTVRRMMVVVAAAAVLLALPSWVYLVCLLPAAVAAMILLPAALAPRRWRVEVAYWATGLHPLTFLGWLAVWRFFLDPGPRYSGPGNWYFLLTFEFPYALAVLSQWYLFALLLSGGILAARRFSGRPLAIPLLVLMVIWPLTCVVVSGDLLQLGTYLISY